jgi:hypothetical protein
VAGGRFFGDSELPGLGAERSGARSSTISRIRRLIDVETHQRVFTWVQDHAAREGLRVGKTVGIDTTTLEANAAMWSILRRDTGDSYQGFLVGLAKASGSRRRRGTPRGLQWSIRASFGLLDWLHSAVVAIVDDLQAEATPPCCRRRPSIGVPAGVKQASTTGCW